MPLTKNKGEGVPAMVSKNPMECGKRAPRLRARFPSQFRISIFNFPILLPCCPTHEPRGSTSPILPNQTLHPPKLSSVCRNQRQLAAQRLPRYQQVVRSDRLAGPLQSVSDFAGTSRVLFPKFQHSHWTCEKHLQAQRIRFRLDALCHAVPKFVQGHRRYPHRPTRLHCLRESLPNRLRCAVDQRDACVGVEQIFHSNSLSQRSCGVAKAVASGPSSARGHRRAGPSRQTTSPCPQSAVPEGCPQAHVAPAPHLPRIETPAAAAPPGCVRSETALRLHSCPYAASSG